MRRSLVRALSIGCLLSAGCAGNSEGSFTPGMEVPGTRFTMLDGTPRLLEEYRGTPVAILFWATNCSNSPPVIAEFNELADQHKGSIRFLAVSLDKNLDSLTERIRTANITTVEHAFSGNEAYDEAYKSFGLEAIPHVVFVNAVGVVTGHATGVRSLREGIQGMVGPPSSTLVE